MYYFSVSEKEMELVVTVRRSAGFAFDMDAGHAAGYSIAGHVRSCGDIARDIVACDGAARLDVAINVIAGDWAAGPYTAVYIVTGDIAAGSDIAAHGVTSNGSSRLYTALDVAVNAHIELAVNVHRGAFIAEFYPAVLGSVAAADKRMPVIEHRVQAVVIRPRQLVVLRLRGGSRAASLPKSSSIVTPNTSASIGKLDTSGLDSPFSHLLTA